MWHLLVAIENETGMVSNGRTHPIGMLLVSLLSIKETNHIRLFFIKAMAITQTKLDSSNAIRTCG